MFENNECSELPAPYELSVHSTVFCAVLCLLTIPVNILLILTITLDPIKKLKNRPFNRLIANLAVADLLAGIIVDPMMITIHYYETKEKYDIFSQLLKPVHCTYFFVSVASVLSITSLVVDRVIAMQMPLAYKYQLSPRRVTLASCVIWIISGSLLVFYFLKGFVVYSFIFINVAVVTTLIFMAVIYTIRAFNARCDMRVAPMEDHVIENVPRRRTLEDIRRLRDLKITSSLFKMLLLFLACYGPSGILIYILNLCIGCSCYTIHWMRDYSFLLVLTNNAANPYFYAWTLPQFRESLFSLLRKRRTLPQVLNQ